MTHDPRLVECVARGIGKAGAGPGDGSVEHWKALQQWQRDYQLKKATAALDAITAAGWKIYSFNGRKERSARYYQKHKEKILFDLKERRASAKTTLDQPKDTPPCSAS